MTTCILYINSSIRPVVFSPSAIYLNDPSYRITDCSGQPLFQSKIWQQLMNPNQIQASKKSPSLAKETAKIATAQRKSSEQMNKRVRRFPRSLVRLLQQTARQDFLYQQQLSFNRMRALKIQQQNSSPYKLKQNPLLPATPESASGGASIPIENPAISPLQLPSPPSEHMSAASHTLPINEEEVSSMESTALSTPEVQPILPLEQSDTVLAADRQTAPLTEEQEMAAPQFVKENITEHSIASGFRVGDPISLSYGSAKIGEGHFIQAGSNYLVWEYDGDMRLQYIGDGIHIEKL